MSDTVNPYQPPASPDEPVAPTGNLGDVSELTRQHLGKASPWLGFLGIMAYIGCGLTAATGLIMMIVPLAGGKLFGSTAQSQFSVAALGLAYLALGVVLFFPARFVYAMGSNAKRYMQAADTGALEGLALNLRKVSKFYGVVIIVTLAVIIAGTIIAIIVAIATTGKG